MTESCLITKITNRHSIFLNVDDRQFPQESKITNRYSKKMHDDDWKLPHNQNYKLAFKKIECRWSKLASAIKMTKQHWKQNEYRWPKVVSQSKSLIGIQKKSMRVTESCLHQQSKPSIYIQKIEWRWHKVVSQSKSASGIPKKWMPMTESFLNN